jgi:hypothetical protein
MPFNPKGKAEFKHINIRKGTADDATVSVDIKLFLEGQSSDVAASALGVETGKEVEHAFHRSISEDSDRNPRFFGMKSIDCDAKWEGKHAITIQGFKRIRAHSVGKVSLVPQPNGKFGVEFSVMIQQPPQGYVENLAEHLNSTLTVELIHDAELELKGGGTPDKPTTGDLLPGKPKAARDIRSGKPKGGRGEKMAAKADVRAALGGNRGGAGKRPKRKAA